MKDEHEMPDPKTIKEILDIVSEKVPQLLKELSGVLYSPEQAKQFGLAGAVFYKELKAVGMTDDQAYALTQQYMSTMSLGSTVKEFAHHGGPYGNPHGHGDFSWDKLKELKKLKKIEES